LKLGKSKEELDAEGERQDLIAEVARLNLEIEKQNKVKEELESKEQRLKVAETAKEKAEKEKEQAENESRCLREEIEKLPRDQEMENAFKAGRDAKTRRIRDIKGETEKGTAKYRNIRNWWKK
jgi:hypothetical protein